MKHLLLRILCIALLLALLAPAAAAEGSDILMLTVSEIQLSLVGDTENIYWGTAPIDAVHWSSEDPDIIAVENGVITAKAVGATTIHASCNDQEVTCAASCLAVNREELLKLAPAVLTASKRLPPQVDIVPEDYFFDTVIIGDSISANLLIHELNTNLLGHPLFIARKNIGVNNFVNHVVDLMYQGQPLHAEDAVAASGKHRAFFLLGMNDIGYQEPGELADKYRVLIDTIQAKNPDVELYLQSSLPVYRDQSFNQFNQKIDNFNLLIAQVAEEKGCHYLDLAAYMENHVQNLAKLYTLDYDAHINDKGSIIWMELLRAYAYRSGFDTGRN